MISKRSVALFQKAVEEIPAYRAFLKEHNFDPASVVTAADMLAVPVSNKKNYLNLHPLQELIWPEDAGQPLLFCSTSGSTGEPYYFPRNETLSWQYSNIIEKFLRESDNPGGKTLVIIGFGMGVWIGGVITVRAFEIAGARMKAPVALLPAGYNKTEIFKALQRLSPQFDQTVMVGYPPFVKELVDEAPKQGIDLKKLNVRFLFAAESFTEKFRDYLCKKAGVASPVRDTLNIYGTADIGAMAFETPLSILIRRLATRHKALFADIFGQIEKTPTLAQYNPAFVEFEAAEGEVLLTGNAALPLIRYAIGDNGGVIGFEEMEKILARHKINLNKEVKKAGIREPADAFPFVYVYERTDFSVTLHGINIFPEFIKEGLLDRELTHYLTERFTMLTKNDRHHNQYLEINVELQKDIRASLKLKALAYKVIKHTLIEKSSEFAEVSRTKPNKRLIRIVFWPNGHRRYFTAGIKQKWVQTQ
jgi:phenylacetate-CoA ligase